MLKNNELRKKTDKELNELKIILKLQLIKASNEWGLANIKQDKSTRSGHSKITPKGAKTSLIRDTKKNIARINTILNERKNGNE